MESGSAIELRGFSKAFGETRALLGIDLRVPPQKTTVLIGPSGCGKSTLLRSIVGLVWPDEGSVCVDGEPITPGNILGVRRRMGYVIQEGGLFPHLTAAHNVTLVAAQLGWPAPKLRARLQELATLVQLPRESLDRYPMQLSGGQRQRVSLMRALMLEPNVLLMDEPLGALDPMIRAELQVELRAIFRSLGKTVVLVTHDLGEAGYFGDRIVLLRDGRIEQQGNLEDLVETPRTDFVRAFIRAQHGPGREPDA